MNSNLVLHASSLSAFSISTTTPVCLSVILPSLHPLSCTFFFHRLFVLSFSSLQLHYFPPPSSLSLSAHNSRPADEPQRPRRWGPGDGVPSRQRELDREAGFPSLLYWILCGAGECMEVSIQSLHQWGRYMLDHPLQQAQLHHFHPLDERDSCWNKASLMSLSPLPSQGWKSAATVVLESSRLSDGFPHICLVSIQTGQKRQPGIYLSGLVHLCEAWYLNTGVASHGLGMTSSDDALEGYTWEAPLCL